MKEEMELSVSSCGSAAERWKQKIKRPLINKIIKRDMGDYALILFEDASKPIRFLYLKLFIGKYAIENIKKLTLKIQTLSIRYDDIAFEDMTVEMKKVGKDLNKIAKQLNVLRKKMEAYHGDHIAIIKLLHDFDIVDPVLILSLRAVAFSKQCKIQNALQCDSPFSLQEIQKILNQFSTEKFSVSSCINRFICFLDLSEIDCQYFKEEAIKIENEASNYEELSDPYLVNYEEHIMIEKLFSLL